MLRRVVVGAGRGSVRLEEQLDVPGEVIDAVAGDLAVPGRFGEDERTLQHRLGMNG
jgi:hypothetical protein